MKKVTVLFLLASVLIIAPLRADVIQLNTTFIRAQLTNLKDFPDLAVVAYEKYNESNGVNFAKNVTQSFRAVFPMSFCVVKKDYLKTVDLIKNNWLKDKHAQTLNLFMDKTTCVSPMYAEILVDYTLAKKGTTYYVYKSGVTYTYRTTGKKKTEQLDKASKENGVDPSKMIYVSEYYL